MSTFHSPPDVEVFKRALREGDGRVFERSLLKLMNDPESEDVLVELMQDDSLHEMLLSHIPSKLIKTFFYRYSDKLTPGQVSTLIQRTCQLDQLSTLHDIISLCLEENTRLPLNTVVEASALLLPEYRAIAFRVFGLFDHENDRDHINDFILSFHQFLKNYNQDISTPSQSQDPSNMAPEEVIKIILMTLIRPDFDPLTFLSHFNSLVLQHLHPLIAIKLISHFIEEKVIPSLLQGSPFEGGPLPSDQDILDADLSFQSASEISYRSHGLLLLLSSKSSDESLNYRDTILDYLQQRHGITTAEKNSRIKLSKRESLINKLYSAVRVSANLRRGGGVYENRNPVTIYVSATELLHSLMPSLRTMECISRQDSSTFRYIDPMAGSNVNALRELFGDDVEKLKELQWKRYSKYLKAL